MGKIWEKNTGKITYNRSARHKTSSTTFNHTTKENKSQFPPCIPKELPPSHEMSEKYKQESTIHEKKEREQDQSSGEISRRKYEELIKVVVGTPRIDKNCPSTKRIIE